LGRFIRHEAIDVGFQLHRLNSKHIILFSPVS